MSAKFWACLFFPANSRIRIVIFKIDFENDCPNTKMGFDFQNWFWKSLSEYEFLVNFDFEVHQG